MENHPRLRSVEAFPVQVEEEDLVCLRDPQGLAESHVFLNRTLLFLVSRMDGSNSLRDIQADFMRAHGQIIPFEQLTNLVERLDEQHYLESERFRDYCAALVGEFLASPTRPARHAGSAYQREEPSLRAQIESFCQAGEGPCRKALRRRPLRGLVAPHIDYQRGGQTYAHAYKALSDGADADCFIIFGTCHSPMRRRFALTRKDFETPLGTVPADRAFVDGLARRLPEDYFADEFAHRGEHSIELQAVFLRHAVGSRAVRIVPILVGSFQDICESGRSAGADPEVMAFATAIRTVMREMPARYAVIAGADLAHVGRRFGDPSGPTREYLADVEKADRRFLELVAAGDAEGVFRSIATDHDRRRVCGYPPIYMTLSCLNAPRGDLLEYRQWADLEGGAAVTFAAVALY